MITDPECVGVFKLLDRTTVTVSVENRYLQIVGRDSYTHDDIS
jgi:hypothetical protein